MSSSKLSPESSEQPSHKSYSLRAQASKLSCSLEVAWKLTRNPMYSRLVPTWVALAGIYAVFEQAIQPGALKRKLAATSPLEQAGWAMLVLAIWGLLNQRHSRALLYHKRLSVLWRSPISARSWSALLSPLTLHMALPTMVAALLWPAPAWANIASFAAAAHPMMIAAGSLSARAMIWAGLALSMLGASQLALRMLPLPALSAGAALTGSLWLGAATYHDLRALPDDRRPLALPQLLGASAKHPRWTQLRALLLRDLRFLWRKERGVVLATMLSVIPLALFVMAVGRHGGEVGTTTAALAATVSPVGAIFLKRLEDGLGGKFAPGRWPVSGALRVSSLLLLSSLPLLALTGLSLLLAPGWTLLELIKPLAALPALLMPLSACIFWSRWRSTAGNYIPFLALAGFFLTMLPAWAALITGWGLGLLGWIACVRLFERRRREIP